MKSKPPLAAVPVAARERASAPRRHPLLASALAYGDSARDFEAFASAFVIDLAPEGPVETTLAARAASLAWRLNRAQRLESAFLSKPDRFSPHKTPVDSALGNPRDVQVLEAIQRWETSVERSLLRILAELERRRSMRKADVSRRKRGRAPARMAETALETGAVSGVSVGLSEGRDNAGNIREPKRTKGLDFEQR